MQKKTLSKETKMKISESMTGVKNHAFGKPLTPEHKYKIRLGMLNYHKNLTKIDNYNKTN